ncbi:MAG: polysaccharide export protein [Planctomycetota bacterium]|nr:polysaccharide export protein [Planctomycetota bacterium]
MRLLRPRMHGQTSRLILAVGVLALAAACSGCQGKVYKAGKLPLEFAAAHTASAHKVDLSRLARTSAQTEVIYSGDVIQITVSTGAEEKTPESWPVRVGDNGEVNVPLVGAIRVAGLLLTDAEQAIRHESIARKVFRDPHVSVLLKDRKSISVTVVGAVKNPGTYNLPAANNDLLHSLVAAGGLTDKASTIVEIRSLPNYPGALASYNEPRKTVAQNGEVQINLLTASEGMMPDYRIADGSVIMVREQDPRTVQVIGLVRKPDQFEIKPDKELHLLDVIALANGRTLEFADKVHVIRQLDGMQEPIVIAASIKAAKRGGPDNLLLATGDVVSVEETPLTFTYSTINNFLRFGFSSALPGL